MTTLSAYELSRLQTIQRNQELLKSLAIPVNGLIPDAPRTPSKRASSQSSGSSAKKKPKVLVPTRRSTRVVNAAEGKIVSQESLLAEAGQKLQDERSGRKEINGDVPLLTLVLDEDAEEEETAAAQQFLELLKSNCLAPADNDRDSLSGKGNGREAQPRDLRVDPRYTLSRVTPQRALCAAFHPYLPVLAAGDKQGFLGFWNLSNNTRLSGQIHTQGITALLFSADGQVLWTASYDGKVRATNFTTGECAEVYIQPDGVACTALAVDNSKRLMYIGLTSGEVALKHLDSDDSAPAKPLIVSIHARKIGCLSLSPKGDFLVSASNDRTVRLCKTRDMKTMKHAIHTWEFDLSVQSAYFDPILSSPTSRILVTSYNDTVTVLDPVDGTTPLTYSHNNRTGRYVTCFRAIWGLHPESALIGSMDRTLEMIDTSGKGKSATRCLQKTGEGLTAIPAVLAVSYAHKLCASINGSGYACIWKEQS